MRIYRRPGSKIWWCQYKGDRFSLKTFHDTLLRNGSLPISFQRRLMTGEG